MPTVFPPVALTDFGFFAAGEPLASTLHRSDELREVHLERVEDVVGVILRAQADLTLARTSVFDDLLGLPFGLPDDFFFADQSRLLLAGLADDPLSLALCLAG